jgi:tetrapyrrole methylase family protein / MazG family protein
VGSIRVLGLGGRIPSDDWSPYIEGRAVAARSAAISAAHTPPGCTYTLGFDDLFETGEPATIATEIADQLIALSASQDVVYLVPGAATVGDVTVETLVRRVGAEIFPGALETPALTASDVRVIDALRLASIESQEPFEASSAMLDPLQPLIVTNWYGTAIVSRATARIRRVFAGPLEHSSREATLIVQPDEWLEGPRSISALVEIVARLRAPDGCPWDREQTAASMLSDLREEVDELTEAVQAEDWQHVAEELGDVLLHVVMQAQIGREAGRFSLDDIFAGLNAKLVRRHPHVFGDITAASAADVLEVWQRVKQQEKDARAGTNTSIR